MMMYLYYMDITLSILLKKPVPGITYGIQKGSGSKYETIQPQQTGGTDMQFNITLQLKNDPEKINQPRFAGPFAQGKPLGQFIYIDIGHFAGQAGVWGGRIKIPLTGIDWDVIRNWMHMLPFFQQPSPQQQMTATLYLLQ